MVVRSSQNSQKRDPRVGSKPRLEAKRKREIISACIGAPTRLPPFMVMINIADLCHTYVEWGP